MPPKVRFQKEEIAAAALNGIKEIIEGAGHELVLLEKYTDKSQLYEAIADADAMIVRSDKITADVIEAAKQLNEALQRVSSLGNSEVGWKQIRRYG